MKTLKSLLLFFCLFYLTESPVKAQFTLNVATYNLRLNLASDSLNAWPLRKEFVKELIRFHELDLFGTQEGFYEMIQNLLELKDYDYVGVGRDDGVRAGEHSAIFYRKSRFELLDSGNFWFSQTPSEPSYGWEAKYRRVCSWAKLKDLLSGKTFYCFCSHFDHQAVVARRESAKLLLENIRKIAGDSPVFCMGDFNSRPKDEPVQMIRGQLKDSREISEITPYGPEATFNGFNWNMIPESRIDYIFIKGNIQVLKYGVLTDSKDKRYPSDHFPVLIRALIP